jgi:hypothetical protein
MFSVDSLIDQVVVASEAEFGRVRRFWSEEEEQFLRENLARLTIEELAAALGRTPEAIKIRLIKLRVPAKSKTPGYLTGLQAAKALGMDVKSIILLRRYGQMPVDQLPGQRHIMRISQLRLYMWAINPDHWMYFKVARMRDLHLKRLVQLAQAKWPDAWWTLGQAERALGLQRGVLNSKLHRGRLRHELVRWGNWWIRRSVALALVIKPCKYLRDGVNYYTPRHDAALLRLEAAGLRYEVIARLMKVPANRVPHRLRQLGILRRPDWSFKERPHA